MNKAQPNSMQARDIAYLLHPQTNAALHAEIGPTLVTRAKGLRVYDGDREYIDAVAGLWNASLGFANERLARVAYDQMKKLGFYHLFRGRTNEPSIELCERLIQMAPVPMSKVMLQSSGSEANDTAAKFTWYYHAAIGKPEKKKIIGRRMGYHGSTCIAASMSGRPDMHAEFGLPLPGFLHTEFPHYYRFHNEGESEEQFSSRMASALEELILKEGPETIGAFIAEPVIGAGGSVMPPKSYFSKIQAVLKEYDILFIVDEVICGFGRTGKMWGCQTYDLEPDMISCAKALSGGFQPISALLINEKVYQALVSQSAKLGNLSHGFTYSGHPVASAVALETLRIYEETDILGHVNSVTPYLEEALRSLADHPLIGDVRSVGLIAGVELVESKATRQSFDPKLQVGAVVANRAMEHGLIVRTIGDTIAIAPSLTVTKDEIEDISGRFARALDEAYRQIARA